MSDVQAPEYPECPKCGCNAVRIVGRGRLRFGRLIRRWRCGHCQYTWTERENWPTKIDPVPGYSTRPEPPPETLPVDEPPAAPAIGTGPPDISPGGAVRYQIVRCPKCGSDRTRITSTTRPIRRHKCKDCGHPFKSVEQ